MPWCAAGRSAPARPAKAAWIEAIAGFAQFLPFVRQQNVEWVLLLLPLHWALLRAFDPRKSSL